MRKSAWFQLAIRATLCAVLALAALSCSRAAPVIQYYSAKLVYFQNGKGYTERFAFFVLPDDPDGPEDIDELRLYHDGEGLMWRLMATDWVERYQDGQLWIGAYGLAPPTGEKMPSGQYRAVIIDKGGERSERTFGFEAPDAPVYAFPEITVSEGVYTIKTDYPDVFFIGYGGDGAYLSTITAPGKTGRVEDLHFANNTTSFALWADDPEHFTGALTDSFPLK